MKLDENYRIEPDNLNWTLIFEEQREIVDKKTGLSKMITTTKPTYHSTYKHALKTYCDEALRPEPTVLATLEAIERLENKIDNLPYKELYEN